MRSSIACVRCRRSKIRCVNDGVGTRCRSCQNAGRNCEYPPPVAPGARQRDSGVGKAEPLQTEGEGRHRAKKRALDTSEDHPPGVGHRPQSLEEALDPKLLTPMVWQELFEIFQIHFSADLPFLHPPTFLKPLRQVNAQPLSESAQNARPPMSPDFLLAFLALTARFHPKLVAHHNPDKPLVASDYYAIAAHTVLAGSWTQEINVQSIEAIQAMLMLGLHEWSGCRGARAWITIGTAIRSAQVVGLQWEMDLDDEPLSRSLALEDDVEHIVPTTKHRGSFASTYGDGDAFIQQEIRRRTFWSCYIMDRYLSSGKYRPQMLHAKDLRIQLPASERAFLFAEKVRTLMLCEEEDGVAGRAEVRNARRASVMLTNVSLPEAGSEPSPRSMGPTDTEGDKGRLEIGEDEGLVSRYIKILEIYGRIIKWSCAGGRRTEQHPPWDRRSEFYQLRKQCSDFRASLPRQHTLTPQNTQAHIIRKTSTPYMLVHTVHLLCTIMLQREYAPFVPLRCSKPEGPLDPPLFPPEKFDVPPGFWEDGARECFKAARDIIDLVRSCQEWTALVETPIVGFAIYNTAFCGVYCINFPWMDPGAHLSSMVSKSEPGANEHQSSGGGSGFEASRKALEMIGQMRAKLRMADGWFRTINRMHQYFRQIKRDYRKNTSNMNSSSGDSPASNRHLSLREGGIGGGLEEFRLLERTMYEFGDLQDQTAAESSGKAQKSESKPFDTILDDAHSHAGASGEDGDKAGSISATRSDNGPWNPINTAAGNVDSGNVSASTASSSQFRSYNIYDRQSQPLRHASQPHPQADTQNVPNFRPTAFQHDATTGTGSLPSPISRTATSSNQGPSPSFSHPHAEYSSWNQRSASYPMPPTQQAVHGADYPYTQPYHPPPLHTTGSYPAPGQQASHYLHDPASVQDVHQSWNETDKQAWLDHLPTSFGGDDYAAFADGNDMGEWAIMSAHKGPELTWLSTLWEGAAMQ